MSFNKTYTCPSCKNPINIDLEECVTDCTPYERSMGSEYEHCIECEDECPICGAAYLIKGSIWEYPEGSENLDDTSIVAV